MSDAEKSPPEAPEAPASQPTELGVLFLAAGLALALVLSLVALIGYLALAPSKSVNPPPAAPSAPPLHGHLLDGLPSLIRRT